MPLLALASGTFCIGVTEFTPMGLLPEIAAAMRVGIPHAGLLVSAYALGVMAGAPAMTVLLARWRQKTALLALMAVFVLGNCASAAAPDFGTLVGARILTSLAHGAFFGIGSVMAATFVPPGRSASALATMFMGLTVANVGGVPAATWLGQAVGWRATFAMVAALGVIAAATLQIVLPRGEPCDPIDLRRELSSMFRPAMLVALGTTVAGAGAMFTTYTFIAPVVMGIGGPASSVTLALVAVGAGFTAGNWIGGRSADRAPVAALVVSLLVLAAVSFLLPSMMASRFVSNAALFVWGAAAFAVVPPVQAAVMRLAGDAPSLASSVNIGAFNVGNALGAFAGGAVLLSGAGLRAVSPAGGCLALTGVLLVASGHLALRTRQMS